MLFGDLLSNLYWKLLPTHKFWLLLFNIVLNSCCDYITFSKYRIKLFNISTTFVMKERKKVLFFCSLFCVCPLEIAVDLKNIYREDIASL